MPSEAHLEEPTREQESYSQNLSERVALQMPDGNIHFGSSIDHMVSLVAGLLSDHLGNVDLSKLDEVMGKIDQFISSDQKLDSEINEVTSRAQLAMDRNPRLGEVLKHFLILGSLIADNQANA